MSPSSKELIVSPQLRTPDVFNLHENFVKLERTKPPPATEVDLKAGERFEEGYRHKESFSNTERISSSKRASP